MSGNVYWLMSATVKDGKLDDLQSLIHQLVTEKQTSEPGTLSYEWSLSVD